MSSLSSTDEMTLEALDAAREEGKFRVLETTLIGYHESETSVALGLASRFLLKLEAPENPKSEPFKPDPNRSLSSRMRDEDAYWRKQQRLRMELNSEARHLSRYARNTEFQYVVPKRISKEIVGGWKGICEWVHEQTPGQWYVKVYADYDQRPGHSFMLFYFEEPEAATLFKLFQI